MPRPDDPDIFGRPVEGPELPPDDWSGWRREDPETIQRRTLDYEAEAGARAASVRRHPAYAHLDSEQQGRALQRILHRRPQPLPGTKTVMDLRRHLPSPGR